MVGKALDCLRQEVCKQGNYYGFVGRDGQEGYRPVCGVLSAKGDLVAFLDADGLESNVDAFHLAGEFAEGVLLAVIVAYCKAFPVGGHCLLQFAKVMFGSGSRRSFVHIFLNFSVLSFLTSEGSERICAKLTANCLSRKKSGRYVVKIDYFCGEIQK